MYCVMPMLKLIMIIIISMLGVVITIFTGSHNCFACVLIMISITIVNSADNSRHIKPMKVTTKHWRVVTRTLR